MEAKFEVRSIEVLRSRHSRVFFSVARVEREKQPSSARSTLRTMLLCLLPTFDVDEVVRHITRGNERKRLSVATGIHFDRDQWNQQKNEIKLGVSHLEAESVFLIRHTFYLETSSMRLPKKNATFYTEKVVSIAFSWLVLQDAGQGCG